MASVMGVRQAAQLDMAAERAGATAADIDKLSQGDMMAQILPFIRGMAVIKIIERIVDLAKSPFCPTGLTVEPDGHQSGESNFEWDPNKVEFYLDDAQKTGVIKGTASCARS
jgi:hypothetical protein